MDGLLILHLIMQQLFDLLHTVLDHDLQLLLLQLQDLDLPVRGGLHLACLRRDHCLGLGLRA